MEVHATINDRVADLEIQLAEMRRLVYARQRHDVSARPVPVWWARTMGEMPPDAYEQIRIYPEQDPDHPICELPAVYLDLTVPTPNTDPIIRTPRSEQPQVTIVSPGGWIPEGIDFTVFRNHDDRMHVLRLPELRVVTLEEIAPDQSGWAKLWLAGEETAIEFKVWNDWLHGDTPVEIDKQCLARLDWGVRHWSVSAGVEC